MAIAVAAAGSMAGSVLGGMAKNAMGGNKSGMKITGTQGVGVATVSERKGKSTKKTYVPQMDITQSLEWFRTAANEQEGLYRQGLKLYEGSMAAAKKEIDAGYNAAFKTLKPMSFASTQASNEMMRFMGLNPLSATYDIKDRAIELGASSTQAKQIADAENLTDPVARAAARDKVLARFTAEQKASTLAADIAELRKTPINYSGYESTNPLNNYDAAAVGLPAGNQRYDDIFNGIATEVGKNYNDVDAKGAHEGALAAYMRERQNMIDRHTAKIDSGIASLQEKDNARIALNKDLLKLQSSYESDFQTTKDVGYTGAEVTAKLESTPGYGFVVDQGTKAIERQGAAMGMLGSGNTLIGLSQFGQKNAQNYFGMHMDTLSNIAQLGSGATNQLSGLQMQQGRDQGQVTQSLGSAQMTAYGAIGDARANSLYQQGNLYADAAKYNTGLINSVLESSKDRDAAAANQQTASAPGMQNAQLGQQQFQYGVFQNQQGGQAYQSARNAGTQINPYGMRV